MEDIFISQYKHTSVWRVDFIALDITHCQRALKKYQKRASARAIPFTSQDLGRVEKNRMRKRLICSVPGNQSEFEIGSLWALIFKSITEFVCVRSVRHFCRRFRHIFFRQVRYGSRIMARNLLKNQMVPRGEIENLKYLWNEIFYKFFYNFFGKIFALTVLSRYPTLLDM